LASLSVVPCVVVVVPWFFVVFVSFGVFVVVVVVVVVVFCKFK
jgi:hypothetical protein